MRGRADGKVFTESRQHGWFQAEGDEEMGWRIDGRRRAQLAAALVCTILSADAVASDQLQRHLEALRNHPGILRLYSFDDVASGQSEVASLAGERKSLSFHGPQPFSVVEGAVPGARAVRLNEGWFQGEPFPVTRTGFTVEMRFRKHGQGTQLGNGRTNGMLFALGEKLLINPIARSVRRDLAAKEP